ncbi:MAG: phosphatase PAP2 family protein [Bacteroidota bacterium]|nr:phosphatase PAP2 family protein [Bacteroidota bacterium]
MKRFSFLTSADAITFLFIVFLILIETIFAGSIQNWILYTTVNVSLCTFIILSTRYVHIHKEKGNRFISAARDWYLVPCILLIYTQTSSINHAIHQRDYDDILIAIDRFIFHGDPTQWVYQFSHPLITEILQIAYSSYYLFFVALFFELYRRDNRNDFNSGAMLIVYGFYLSYIGYLLLPAVGPRFTLHNYFSTETELPGIFITEFLRGIVNSGGGIPVDVPNPIDFVNRDAFPSGHTQLTLAAMYVAFTTKTKIRWWLFVAGSLLIISTIYMRYHYVTDVIVGIVFFFFTIWSGKRINAWWNEGIKNV